MTPDGLERAIGHRFARRELLAQALTHRSHSAPHNERLEFLGDSVLNCSMAALLYRNFPALKEGELSRLRASLVKQDALADVAMSLKLGSYIKFGEGELKSGGDRRPSTLADALEAVFGAVYLDAGFDAAIKIIESLYQPQLQRIDPAVSGKDAKTELQEFLQGRRLELPRYELRTTRGEAHAQQFDVDCLIPHLGIRSSGTGASRRIAEQEAARRALEMVKIK
ncbi:MAG: ribonuclease III [Georgfuchsia sp.]